MLKTSYPYNGYCNDINVFFFLFGEPILMVYPSESGSQTNMGQPHHQMWKYSGERREGGGEEIGLAGKQIEI